MEEWKRKEENDKMDVYVVILAFIIHS